VLASLLLGSPGLRLPVGPLVRAAGKFGVAEGSARTALSRMVDRSEVTMADGWYELTGRLAERGARQFASRVTPRPDWDGQWITVLIAAERRAAPERASFRMEMVDARFAELRPGVWLRPTNLGVPVTGDDCVVVTGTVDDDRALAGRLWDLAGWADLGRVLRDGLPSAARGLRREDVASRVRAFEAGARVLRHLVTDPMLPAELLPRHWPGPALRAAYDEYEAAFRDSMREWRA